MYVGRRRLDAFKLLDGETPGRLLKVRVVLVASTLFHDADAETCGWVGFPEGDTTTSADKLADFGGRSCYQSFNRPNPDTADNKGYLANILDKGHESVLAHASATFYVTGVSRTLTHELIRSRFLAFSELSQRYVDMGTSYTVVPPAIRGDWALEELIRDHHDRSVNLYDRIVDALAAQGVSGKKAREAARAVLPGGTETRIVVSGNLRAWLDFVRQRNTVHADQEIQLFAREVLRQLKGIAPNTFQNVSLEPTT